MVGVPWQRLFHQPSQCASKATMKRPASVIRTQIGPRSCSARHSSYLRLCSASHCSSIRCSIGKSMMPPQPFATPGGGGVRSAVMGGARTPAAGPPLMPSAARAASGSLAPSGPGPARDGSMTGEACRGEVTASPIGLARAGRAGGWPPRARPAHRRCRWPRRSSPVAAGRAALCRRAPAGTAVGAVTGTG